MADRTGEEAEALAFLHVEQAQKAIAELRQFLAADRCKRIGGASAYRTLVLLGRLRQLEQAGLAGDVLTADDQLMIAANRQVELLKSLVENCELPDEHELCLELMAELESEEDPVAAVQPVLLAIEDQISVRELLADSDRAASLARETAATVALYPDGLAALGPRAELQLAGLPSTSAAEAVWQETLAAPGWLAAESLEAPSVAERSGRAYVLLAKQAIKPVKARPALTRRLPLRAALPAWERAAAASSAKPLDVPLKEVVEGTEVGSLYTDSKDGHLKVCIWITDAPANLRVNLVLRDAVSGQARGMVALPVERSSAELFADLGERVGPASARHKLLASAAPELPDDRVQFQIEVEQDG